MNSNRARLSLRVLRTQVATRRDAAKSLVFCLCSSRGNYTATTERYILRSDHKTTSEPRTWKWNHLVCAPKCPPKCPVEESACCGLVYGKSLVKIVCFSCLEMDITTRRKPNPNWQLKSKHKTGLLCSPGKLENTKYTNTYFSSMDYAIKLNSSVNIFTRVKSC